MLTREGISDETSFLCSPFDGHLSSIGNTQDDFRPDNP
jgi:hypothetical protein